MENSKKNNNQKEQREKRDLFSVRLFSVEKSNKLQKYDGTYCEFSRGTITTICERKHKTQKGRRVDKKETSVLFQDNFLKSECAL